MTRRQHIEQLANEMRLEIEYSASRYGMAVDTESRVLYLAPWEDVLEEEAYWVALHEMGHQALSDANDISHRTRKWDDNLAQILGLPHYGPEREAMAWAWALDHSLFPVTQAPQSSMAWGIADRLVGNYLIGPGLERVFAELGEDPDWYFNVTEPEHFAKLDGYAKPRWAEFSARIRASSASDARRHGRGEALPT